MPRIESNLPLSRWMEREDEEVGGAMSRHDPAGWWRQDILTGHGNLSDKLINYPKKYKIMKIC